MSKDWQTRDRFLELHSRWMTLIGEHLEDDRGEILEYWRIEKADSVIVLAIQGDRILLPSPNYRVGISKTTLDFAGGRVNNGQTTEQAAIAILKRELGIELEAIAQIIPLNSEGWSVNSSFSNQKLYGFIAHIQSTVKFPPDSLAYPINTEGLHKLLKDLICLQCRALLMEWMLQYDYLRFHSE